MAKKKSAKKTTKKAARRVVEKIREDRPENRSVPRVLMYCGECDKKTGHIQGGTVSEPPEVAGFTVYTCSACGKAVTLVAPEA